MFFCDHCMNIYYLNRKYIYFLIHNQNPKLDQSKLSNYPYPK